MTARLLSICCRRVWSALHQASVLPQAEWRKVLLRYGLIGGTLCASALLAGCTVSDASVDAPMTDIPARLPTLRLGNRKAVDIDSVTADKADETVTVSGIVANRVAVLDGWLYQVTDDSGSLWVLTNASEPDVGLGVTVEGVVRYEPIVVEDIDASGIYLAEQAYMEESTAVDGAAPEVPDVQSPDTQSPDTQSPDSQTIEPRDDASEISQESETSQETGPNEGQP